MRHKCDVISSFFFVASCLFEPKSRLLKQQLITVLPSGIVGAIEAIATTKHQRERFVRLLSYMLGKCINDEVDFDTPLEVSKDHYRNQVGVHYLKDLQALCDAGIVHTNHKYIKPKRDKHTGEKIAKGQCKRYTFNKDLVFTSPDFVTHHAETSKMFAADYVVRQTVPLLAQLKCIRSLSQMKKLVLETVTREYVLARCKVNDAIPQGAYEWKDEQTGYKQTHHLDFILKLAKKGGFDAILYDRKVYLSKLDKWVDDRMDSIQTSHVYALTKLSDIRKRSNIYCARNDRNRRLDHNLTNIKKEYLEYYTLDGEQLWSIDLSNSQFTLKAKVIDEWQNANNQQLSNEDISKNFNSLERCGAAKCSGGNVGDGLKNTSSTLSKLSYPHVLKQNLIFNAAHFYKNEGKKAGLNDCNSKSLGTEKNMKIIIAEKDNMGDLEEFKTATRAGVFYETFQQILKNEGQTYTRDEIKKMMFLMLFSAAGYSSAEKKLLAKYYPNVVAFAKAFKRAFTDFYISEGMNYHEAKDKGNAALAVTLQQIESAIFIDCILTRLLKSGYRVFSKHDSILCKESDVEAVTAIVREELNRELGIGAYTLKTELA